MVQLVWLFSLPCVSFMWFVLQVAPNEPAPVYLVIGTSFLMGDMCLKDWFKSE